IKILLDKDIVNVVKYIDFKENSDGSGDITMEKLENPNFSDKEKEMIGFFFSEIQQNISIENSKINYENLNYDSCISSLNNHIDRQINEFKDTDFQKDFITYKELLGNKKLDKVFKDIFTGFKNLLEINIFFDD